VGRALEGQDPRWTLKDFLFSTGDCEKRVSHGRRKGREGWTEGTTINGWKLHGNHGGSWDSLWKALLTRDGGGLRGSEGDGGGREDLRKGKLAWGCLR